MATLSEILQFIYENDPSIMPTTDEEISALETSTNSRDTLAFVLFGMRKAVQNGEWDFYADAEANSEAAVEETAGISTYPSEETSLSLEKERKIQELADQLSAISPNYAEKIRAKKDFRQNPAKFLKHCVVESPSKDPADWLMASEYSTLEKPQRGVSLYRQETLATASETDMMMDSEIIMDSFNNSEMTMDFFGDPNNACYLTGENVWEGTIFLDGPVYVYDANGIPASLEIKEESLVIPLSEDAGIYLIEGSTLKARKAYFGPLPNGFVEWKGIFLDGEPAEFLFDENEVRAAEKGLSLEHYDYVHISDTVFKWCMDGIVASPGTVRINNCVFDDSYWTGVTYYMETVSSDPNGCSDPNIPCDPNDFLSDAIPGSGLYMDNCTITGSFYDGYAHDCGVFVHGTNEMEDAGSFEITDCLITSSCVAGIYQEGWQSALWQNNAFFHNANITNPGNPFEDPNSIDLPDNPDYDPFHYYVDNGYGYWDMLYFIWPQSEIIDAASTHIFNSPLIGKTTLVTGVPDIIMEDIGYHYSNENYYDEGVVLKTDITGDNFVNLDDFRMLAGDWQWSLDPNDWPTTDPNDPAYHEPNALLDADGDLLIGLGDLIVMSNEWLMMGTGEEGKGMIVVKLDGNPLLTTSVTASGLLDFTFEFIDPNEIVESLRIERDNEEVMTIDFDEEGIIERHYYEKSWRLKDHVKYVFRALMANGDFITSRPYDFNFDNKISIDSNFKYGLSEDTVLPVSFSGENSYTLAIFNGQEDPNDPNDVLSSALYTQEISDSGDITIPKEVFADDFQLYGMAVYENDSGQPGGISAISAWEDLLTLDINKLDTTYWYDTRAVISIGNKDLVGMEVPKIMLKETYRDLHSGGMNVLYITPDMELDYFKKHSEEYNGYTNLVTVGHFLANATLWYHFSHGNDNLPTDRARQVCCFGNKKVFSHLWSDYDDQTRPSGLQKLLIYENCWSIRRGLQRYDWPLGAVVFDGCEHGKTDEFPTQLGIFSTNQPDGGSIFLGWKSLIPMYDNVLDHKIYGDYGEYRKLMAYSWTRKIAFGFARDNDCDGLLNGHTMRDNWYVVGANAYSSHWCTPNIEETVDHK